MISCCIGPSLHYLAASPGIYPADGNCHRNDLKFSFSCVLVNYDWEVKTKFKEIKINQSLLQMNKKGSEEGGFIGCNRKSFNKTGGKA